MPGIPDEDPHRNLVAGSQKYKNCLAFAFNHKIPVHGQRFSDACSEGLAKFTGIVDFALIMQRVQQTLKLDRYKLKVVGTSRLIPTQYAPSISKRKLIGVGRENEHSGDLHFYVVTQTNGDGHGICGMLDAQINAVLPCRLRRQTLGSGALGGDILIQHSGHGSPTQEYKLIGFIELEYDIENPPYKMKAK